MKRKLIALLLAVVMLMGLAVPAMAASEVVMTSQSVYVNGEAVETEVYNIDGNNYFKLRDVAAMLNGSDAQFDVYYDCDTKTIEVTTNTAYNAIGNELKPGEDKSASCVVASQSVEINGEKAELTVYNIGGNTFFKLAELAKVIGFELSYDEASKKVEITVGEASDYIFRCVDPTTNKADIEVTSLAERIDDFAGKTIAVCANYNGAFYDYPEGIVLKLVELLPESEIVYVSEMPVATGQSTYPRNLEGVKNITFDEFLANPSDADAAILLHAF